MSRNEFNAIRVVRRHTSITRHTSIMVPKPLDLIVQQNAGEDNIFPFQTYMIMTRVAGQSLATIPEVLSDKDVVGITSQMQGFIRKLRAITRSDSCLAAAPFVIGNNLGGPIHDNRVRGSRPVGPFADEDSFSKILRYPYDPGRKGHSIVFSHADLNLRNILIDLYNLPDGTRGWRVSAIVDWEFAGFYSLLISLCTIMGLLIPPKISDNCVYTSNSLSMVPSCLISPPGSVWLSLPPSLPNVS